MKNLASRVGTMVWLAGALCVGVATPHAAVADEQVGGLDKLDFRDVIRRSKNSVFPAVVYIKCLRESHEAGKRIASAVTGSGVIVSPGGEVLTNWHVIDKAVEVRCLLYDGRAFDAEIKGKDKDMDIALVQLKMPAEGGSVPYAELGDSSVLTEGDFVMAMGAPWGMSRSVSIGIISCTSRYLPETSEYSLWLQTDASISPGNSGGPLVNTDGKVIGLNTRGIMAGGDLGFAVPSNAIAQVLPRLREHGDVRWSWTGLNLQPLRDFDRNVFFDGTDGVIVASTEPESPARRAGLLDRDRILAIGDHPVTGLTEEDLPDIRRSLGLLKVDHPVTLTVRRGNDVHKIDLTPRLKGTVEGAELDCPRWDMTVKAINQFDNPQLYFYRKEGVFIFGVKYPGNAASAGLQTNDIILKIDNQPVATLDDVKAVHKQLIANVAAKHRVMISVQRGGQMRQVILDFSRDYEKE